MMGVLVDGIYPRDIFRHRRTPPMAGLGAQKWHRSWIGRAGALINRLPKIINEPEPPSPAGVGSSDSSQQPQAKPQQVPLLMLTRTVALRPTKSQVMCKLLSRLKEGKVWFWEGQGLGVDIRLPEPLIRQVCERHGPLARLRIIFLTQGQQRQLRN